LSDCTTFSSYHYVVGLYFPLESRYFVYNALATLQPTSERLGTAATFTTVHAGYKRSFSHCRFCGITAAVAPNRQLYAGLYSLINLKIFSSNSFPLKFFATIKPSVSIRKVVGYPSILYVSVILFASSDSI